MKIGLEYNSIPHAVHRMPEQGAVTEGSCAGTGAKNKFRINTTVSKNTHGRTSFNGGVSKTLANEIGDVSKKLTGTISERLSKSAGFKTVLSFISDNVLLSEALFALLITCIARPATIMLSSQKAENKEKNKYQAAKSIASGVIGLAATYLVSQPIKKGVEKAMKNIKLDPSIGTKYTKSLQDTLNRVHNPIFLPLRAAATIAFVPLVLNAFGVKKEIKKPETTQKAETTDASMHNKTIPDINGTSPKTLSFSQAEIKPVFQDFSGVNKNENK